MSNNLTVSNNETIIFTLPILFSGADAAATHSVPSITSGQSACGLYYFIVKIMAAGLGTPPLCTSCENKHFHVNFYDYILMCVKFSGEK